MQKLILGQQDIGDSTEGEQAAFAEQLSQDLEKAFPGLSVSYRPWQPENSWEGDDTLSPVVAEWIEQNWQRILREAMTSAVRVTGTESHFSMDCRSGVQ